MGQVRNANVFEQKEWWGEGGVNFWNCPSVEGVWGKVRRKMLVLVFQPKFVDKHWCFARISKKTHNQRSISAKFSILNKKTNFLCWTRISLVVWNRMRREIVRCNTTDIMRTGWCVGNRHGKKFELKRQSGTVLIKYLRELRFVDWIFGIITDFFFSSWSKFHGESDSHIGFWVTTRKNITNDKNISYKTVL